MKKVEVSGGKLTIVCENSVREIAAGKHTAQMVGHIAHQIIPECRPFVELLSEVGIGVSGVVVRDEPKNEDLQELQQDKVT